MTYERRVFIHRIIGEKYHVRTYPEKMVELLSACRTASTETTDATVFYLSPLYTTDNLIHCCLLENNFINNRFRADRGSCRHLPYRLTRLISFSIVPRSFQSRHAFKDFNGLHNRRSGKRLSRMETRQPNEGRPFPFHFVSRSYAVDLIDH